MPSYIGKIASSTPVWAANAKPAIAGMPAGATEAQDDARRTPALAANPEPHRAKVKKWRTANADKFLAGKLARNAVRGVRKVQATITDTPETRKGVGRTVGEGQAHRQVDRPHHPDCRMPRLRRHRHARAEQLEADVAAPECGEGRSLSRLHRLEYLAGRANQLIGCQRGSWEDRHGMDRRLPRLQRRARV